MVLTPLKYRKANMPVAMISGADSLAHTRSDHRRWRCSGRAAALEKSTMDQSMFFCTTTTAGHDATT